MAAIFATRAFAGIQFSVNIGPPPIAAFDQPSTPGDGYIWTPGYYQYGDYGYYRVPVSGFSRPPQDFSGHLAIGASGEAGTTGTKGIGASKWADFNGCVRYCAVLHRACR